MKQVKIKPCELSHLKIKVLLACLDCLTFDEFLIAYERLTKDSNFKAEHNTMRKVNVLLNIEFKQYEPVIRTLEGIYAQRGKFQILVCAEI